MDEECGDGGSRAQMATLAQQIIDALPERIKQRAAERDAAPMLSAAVAAQLLCQEAAADRFFSIKEESSDDAALQSVASGRLALNDRANEEFTMFR